MTKNTKKRPTPSPRINVFRFNDLVLNYVQIAIELMKYELSVFKQLYRILYVM